MTFLVNLDRADLFEDNEGPQKFETLKINAKF